MQFQSKVNTYKSPVTAMLWSIAFPGMGQLYNRDYLVGFVLIFLEIAINQMGNLNSGIYYAFTGRLNESYEVIDPQWVLYYPSFYAFSIWDAYNRAKTINHQLELKNVPIPPRKAYYIGLFFGFMVGLNLGMQWNLIGNPIFGALLGGLIGAILGQVIELVLYGIKGRV